MVLITYVWGGEAQLQYGEAMGLMIRNKEWRSGGVCLERTFGRT